MIVNEENRHYTTIKNFPRRHKPLNPTHEGTSHLCMSCLNGFHTASLRGKHCEYYSTNGRIKVKMPSEKER